KYEVGSLAFEFSGKDTALFGHLTPRYGEHSRLNGCPVSLDHYIYGACRGPILPEFRKGISLQATARLGFHIGLKIRPRQF
ncbi:hypothetical protein, partial [Pseudomonas kulmbachensis]|uniref:hypothetical protein n=1 Tax=Pseudomonas kulmbachensis TaxID=3043408 RepID=UPI002AAFF38E